MPWPPHGTILFSSRREIVGEHSAAFDLPSVQRRSPPRLRPLARLDERRLGLPHLCAPEGKQALVFGPEPLFRHHAAVVVLRAPLALALAVSAPLLDSRARPRPLALGQEAFALQPSHEVALSGGRRCLDIDN